ncbi:MAG: hypothetical protein QOJ89_3247 [bacterium]
MAIWPPSALARRRRGRGSRRITTKPRWRAHYGQQAWHAQLAHAGKRGPVLFIVDGALNTGRTRQSYWRLPANMAKLIHEALPWQPALGDVVWLEVDHLPLLIETLDELGVRMVASERPPR